MSTDIFGLNEWYWIGAVVVLLVLWGVARYGVKQPVPKKKKK